LLLWFESNDPHRHRRVTLFMSSFLGGNAAAQWTGSRSDPREMLRAAHEKSALRAGKSRELAYLRE